MTGARSSRVKAADVAAMANVSVATVSLVTNGKAHGRVSESTRVRVETVIRDLGYVVNPAARSLVTGRHGRIALLAHDLTNPFIAALASGVSEALGHDLQLILAVGGAGDRAPDVAMVSSFGVDGLLISLDDTEYEPVPDDLPVVYVDEPDAHTRSSRVFFDLAGGAGALAAHLVEELGHRTIVYLDAIRPRLTFSARRRHFQEHLRRIEPATRLIRSRSEIDLEAAGIAAGKALPGWLGSGVTAVVTATDVQAYGVLTAAADAGIPVPGVLSVASFDNNAMSAVTWPPLTAVDLSARDIGREAGGLLLQEIMTGTLPGREIRLPTRLVVRSSTAPARDGP
ncbi:LacI family DNA-binding transcriptional regulator [Nakamurella alba]|nr:LacI family DNA-binding transcriptional regulator [Nakamurella alba]